MRPFLIAAAAAASFVAAPASAMTFAYSFLVDGNDTNVNTPFLTVTNESDAGVELTGFEVTIGDTGFNFDYIFDLAAPAGGTIAVNTLLTDSVNGGARTDVAAAVFTGFDTGESAGFRFDVDPDDSNQNEDWRVVMTGVGEEAVATATFSAPGLASPFTLSTTLFASGVDGVQGFYGASETVGDAAIPLPAALPLFAAGLGALGVAGRRRRARRG